jgi:hypothetical protein
MSAAQPVARRMSIGVGPIRIPDYLRRQELVVRTSTTQVDPVEVDRWAEPLDRSVPRVISENLAFLLGTDQVLTFPWYESSRPAYQVEVRILRFEPSTSGAAVLAARWDAREIGVASTRVSHETNVTRQATGPDPAQVVAALSAALGDLSREIADALRAMPPPTARSDRPKAP